MFDRTLKVSSKMRNEENVQMLYGTAQNEPFHHTCDAFTNPQYLSVPNYLILIYILVQSMRK